MVNLLPTFSIQISVVAKIIKMSFRFFRLQNSISYFLQGSNFKNLEIQVEQLVETSISN